VDPTPRPGPNAESRAGRSRGRDRKCYVCGTFGCHSSRHEGKQAAELRRYEQARSSSVPPDNRSQRNGPRSSPTGNRAPTPPPPPAVPVGPPLQSDRPPTSGPIWTGTPDEPRTSTNVVDEPDDLNLTDVKTPYFSFVPVTTSVAADATAIDSATVDSTATASCFAPFLINSSRSDDVPMLNMLPHVIAKGMAPNVWVTFRSVVIGDKKVSDKDHPQ